MKYMLRLLWSVSCLILNALSEDLDGNTNSTAPAEASTNDEIQRNCRIPGLYCSPLTEDIWYVNKPHILRWNKFHPTVVSDGTLTISLFLSEDSRDPIFSRGNVSNGDGSFPIIVSRNQFYMFNNDSVPSGNESFITKKAWFKLTPSKDSAIIDPTPSYFHIIDPSPKLYSTLSSPAPSEAPPATIDIPFSEQTSAPSLPVYGIVLIVLLSVVLTIVMLLLAFFAWRRRNSDRQRLDIGLSEKALTSASSDGDQRHTSIQSNLLAPSGSRSSAQTVDSRSPLARKTNLSANDAIMLSETFRELLRKPSWVDDSNLESRELENSPSQPNNSISLRLEEELALDGVGLLEVDSKRNLTVIHDVQDPIDKSEN